MSSSTLELTGVLANRLADLTTDISYQHPPSLCPRKDYSDPWNFLLAIPDHRALHYALYSNEGTKLLAIDAGLGAAFHGMNQLFR
jgi:hypothetical protein